MQLGVDLRNDFAFRRAFGNEQHPRVLIHLLNSVLGLTGDDRIVAVQILNPIIEVEALGDKMSILDIRVRDQRGRQYTIEMQMVAHAAFPQRIVYYLTKLHGGQLQQGHEYARIRPTISICFLDDILFSKISDCHVPFQMWNPKWKCAFNDDLQIHLFQLPRFQKKVDELTEPMDVWLYVLNNGRKLNVDELPESLSQVPEVVEVLGVMRTLTQSEKEWALYEDREKARRDELSRTRMLEELEESLAAARAALASKEAALACKEAALVSKEAALVSKEAELQRATKERQRAEQALVESQRKGELIGQIRLLEQLLGRRTTPVEDLQSKSSDELTALFASLQQDHRSN